MRRLTVILLLLCSYAFARGGSSHSSHHSTSHAARTQSAKSHEKSKTIHVREYTRKDGTVVHAHDRRPPGTAGAYQPGHVAEGYAPHASVQRDSHGKIKRSKAARTAFLHQQPCPSTGKTSGRCPGYVVDHVMALECGGADDPSNMQWQAVEAAKAKDKTERLCR